MVEDRTSNDAGEFVVVLRATSAPMFGLGSRLRLNSQIENRNVVLTFQTRHREVGLSSPLPGDLWVDARGPASSLEEAVTLFAKVAGGVVAAIAFGANAAIGDLEPELAFDNTRSVSKRVFLQSLLPDEGATVHVRRIVNIKMTCCLLEAIQDHDEKERILRSISQYNLALRHWRWGHETLATEHLFMGTEALTKAIARYGQAKSGLSDEGYAKNLGIDVKKLPPRKSLHSAIVEKVRKDVLFKGDADCHRSAKRASDGFEHGFLPYDRISESAVKARDKTASYLRDSIIDLLDLDQASHSFFMDKTKNKPLGNWPVVKYVRGHLVGESDDLAAEGNVYPILSCKSQLKSITQNETGDYVLSVDEQMTARLGSEIKFQSQSFEVWRP